MDKIMLEVRLPVANKYYDVRVPANSCIGDVLPLLEQALEELEKGYYLAKGDSVLCDGETGKIFDLQMTVREAGIVNGSKVILM